MVRLMSLPRSSLPCIVADTKTAIESGQGIDTYCCHCFKFKKILDVKNF